MRPYGKVLAALVVVAVVTPVGLYLPEIMKAGSSWGEWSLREIRSMIGYTPAGMQKTADTWKAPMPGYAPPGQEQAPLPRRSAYYVFSALAGLLLCGAAGWLVARRLAGRKRPPAGR